MKFSLADVAVLAGLVFLYLQFKSGKLNPASRDNVIYQATGEIGLKIPDMWGGLFKSSAEREVDKLGYNQPKLPAQSAPSPTRKALIVPTGEARVIGTSGVLTSGSYRDLVR